MDEKTLLTRYVEARREKERIEALLKDATTSMNYSENELIKFMEDNGVTSTAKYDGIGRLALIAPQLRCSIADGREEEAFKYLREHGERDAIKEVIHWRTLNAIMKPKVENNEPLPEFFNYFFQAQTRYEQPK